MSLSSIGYIIYLPIIIYITVIVGRTFHKNGIYYIELVIEDSHLAHSINNLLLLGYYLINIGYAFVSLRTWTQINTIPQLFEEVSLRTGIIILFLTLLHYINIIAISLWSYLKKKQKINTN